MNRPASAQVTGMTDEAKAMWDRLEFVSIKDMQAAMVKANVPDAGTTVWKLDLINLAIEHKFDYVVPRMRLLKAPKPLPAAALSSHAVVPYAAIPLQPPPLTTSLHQ